MSSKRAFPLQLTIGALAAALCVQLVSAQGAPMGKGKADGQKAGAAGVPTFSGKGKVTDAIDGEKGALFDIGLATIFFPPGIPVGSSRLVTLSKGRSAPAKSIHSDFKVAGPALDFNGAFSSPARPMVVSVQQKKSPTKAGLRLVIAVEIGTFCDDHNKQYKLKSGLCSGWELHEASYDAAGKQMVARLESTGGLRLQFGLVPESVEVN